MLRVSQKTISSVHDMCRILKLKQLDKDLEQTLDEIKSLKLNPVEALHHILSQEVSHRKATQVELGLKLAKFPRVCTLEGFSFDVIPALDPALIRGLAELDWLEQKKNLLLLGPPGVGKTHIVIALGRKAVEAGHTVRFITAAALLKQLDTAQREGRLEARLAQFMKPKLLIIDEIGYLPLEANISHLFYQLVAARYERNSIALTSNRPVREWGLIFNDPTAATAILDRLLHHSEAITIRGDSYRLLEKKREGLLGQPTGQG